MWGSKRRRKRKGKWYDNCDCDCSFCDFCDFCDFNLLSSTLLALSRLGGRRRGSRADAAVTAAIRGYRRISPRLPTRCPYTPTCSAYGLDAVQRYGTRKGLRLTAGRLRRCRPGVTFGTADPVP
ncbi:membrane protein insertion efficiency factor YidD [Actinoplanes sp. ATCC 53533]|uniref:membrane protein insertion efficiency factor YidD n=1 Tax=Actinoplanes sp. ATCC 53533 TaxID=1288362 RepID=UPI001F1C91CA|nr:membrane protein insertion efficiency factor YidD [Actinoplanes sp. ATCC 53533]